MILLLCLLVKVCVVACDAEFYVLSLGDVPLFCYAQTGPWLVFFVAGSSRAG